MANHTTLPPLPSYTLTPQPSLIPHIPDAYTTLALPIIAYWLVSLLFHIIDTLDLFPQYRLHTPAEVLKRNHVSRYDVFRDVVIQQVIQTIVGVGLTWADAEVMVGRAEYDIAVWAQRIRKAQSVVPVLLGSLGLDAAALATKYSTGPLLSGFLSGGVYPTTSTYLPTELLLAKLTYHLLLPSLQFLAAVCIVDTWQYFLHRLMHTSSYLYTTFHSRHHRLYVPYAYGALYNHPFEGFLLDTLGTGLAYLLTGMTVRQSMWFFTFSTIKTVDDHCGYAFPWDVLQRLTGNNAGYHDVHHQSWGIKTNFSQPFFTFWDGFLGTKWTGGDVSARYERARVAAQKKVDADASASITGSKKAESAAVSAIYSSPPAISAPTAQALASQAQVLADSSPAGGSQILAEENAEETQAQQSKTPVRRSTRQRSASSGLKGLAERLGESFQGKGTGVLGVESGRR